MKQCPKKLQKTIKNMKFVEIREPNLATLKKQKVYLRVYKDAKNMDFCKNDVFCHQTTLVSTLFCVFEKL